MGVYFGHGGEDAGDELEGVVVPFVGVGHHRSVVVGKMVGPLCQLLLVHAHEAPFVREVPVREVARVLVRVEGVVDFDPRRKKGLRQLEDFAAVGTVAVAGEVGVELRLEADVVARRRVGRRCC